MMPTATVHALSPTDTCVHTMFTVRETVKQKGLTGGWSRIGYVDQVDWYLLLRISVWT